ncbi:MAG: excinuclease ABC subunit UvrC [Clostridia bacterium]|nr:excinuclease ABC subunit UvrC [Clostridia bacterium]
MFDMDEQLKNLPDSPGVYLHKDAFGQIIYVGKAISLKNRVRQYFHSPKNQPAKVRKMVEQIAEFEYITTGTEMEALILECNLIKQHMPKYNVLLRDDKTFPFIKITLGEEYPRIVKTRKVLNDNSKYFGPYSDAGAVNEMIDLLNTAYSLKRCATTSFSPNAKPCLHYHIKQCPGVCLGLADQDMYGKAVSKVMDFLQGKDKDLIHTLTKKMKEAAERLDFEAAASFRNSIEAAKAVTEKQRVVLSHKEDLDVVLTHLGASGTHVVLFTVREGKLSGRESFYLGDLQFKEKEEVAEEFIKQYYYANVFIPKEILLEKRVADSDLLSQWLTNQKGSKVTLTTPSRGEKRALLSLVRQDADEMVKTLDERVQRRTEKQKAVIKGFSEILSPEKVKELQRIEAYDISNINGIDAVGGMVVFLDGYPYKKGYRRFKIRTIEGPNDVGSLQEVLFRRFQRAKEASPGFEELPDLILMDGGTNQVNAAKSVLAALHMDVPVAGMVKDGKHRTSALLYEEGEVELKAHPELFAFIGTVQEEVHRFAIDYHRKLRGKNLSRSVLDGIEGIGEKRKLALLSYFGSVDAIKEASVEDLAVVPSLNRAVAQTVHRYFSENQTENDSPEYGEHK